MIIPKSIKEERLNRLIVRKYFNPKYNDDLIEFLKNNVNDINKPNVLKTIEYIKNTNFTHPGLNSLEYIVHPLRITAIISQIDHDIDIDVLNIALLHNIFEVSEVTEKEFSLLYSSNVLNALKVLKVDRSLENDISYKKKYYDDIISLSSWVSIVKAIDKFDNLFLLCLNPSHIIRTSYLNEIENFILPMVKNYIPNLLEYYQELLADCKIIGFLDKEKSLKLYGKDYS